MVTIRQEVAIKHEVELELDEDDLLEQIMEEKDLNWLIDSIGSEEILSSINDEEIIEHIGTKNILSNVDIDDVLEAFEVSDILDNIPTEKVLESVSAEDFVNNSEALKFLTRHLVTDINARNRFFESFSKSLLEHTEAMENEALGVKEEAKAAKQALENAKVILTQGGRLECKNGLSPDEVR